MNNGYNGYNNSQNVNNGYQQNMMYGQQPMNGNPNMMYGQPNFGPQKKDNSGIKFLIVFVIVVALIAVGAYYLIPALGKVSAEKKLVGTWVCQSEGIDVEYTFNDDESYKALAPMIDTTIEGKYKVTSYGSFDNDNYGEKGYKYLKLDVKIDKMVQGGQEVGGVNLVYYAGIKDGKLNLIVSAETAPKGIMCTKK